MILSDSIKSKTVLYRLDDLSVVSSIQPEAYGITKNQDSTHAYYFPQAMQVKTFVTHGLKKSHMMIFEKKINETLNPWYGLLVMLMFMIIVLSKVIYPRRFQQFLKASLNNNGLSQLLREWHPLSNSLSYIYSFVYFLGLSIMIVSIIDYLGGGLDLSGNAIVDFGILFGGISVYVIGKYQTIIGLSILFNVKDSGVRYLANQIVFSLISSLIMIPILLMLIYNAAPSVIYFGLALITIIQFWRILRSFAVGLSENDFGLLYLFLYLCALEIVPILLLVKALIVVSGDGLFG